ncbi:MAG TPA: class I SAM-dependent methyltransferase [Bryobacteraceae bacterium]|nr:class I SAM-dependent methyltransferase [Bryobacteraceae bacterium]
MSEYTYADDQPSCSSQYVLPAVQEALRDLPSNAVVADLGCGNGFVLAHFRQPNRELHGFEVSRTGLAEAARAYPDIHFEEADLAKEMDSHALAGRCDAVISTEVVEHVFLPRVYARNCHRLLKPNGALVISTPYHGYLKNLFLAAADKMDFHYTALWDYGHIKFWSRRTLTRLLEEAGFQVTQFRGVGRLPYLWKSMVLVARKREQA